MPHVLCERTCHSGGCTSGAGYLALVTSTYLLRPGGKAGGEGYWHESPAGASSLKQNCWGRYEVAGGEKTPHNGGGS